MAVGAATAFYPIQQPCDRDAILRVGASAWCAAMQFPCQPASSMSAEAAAGLLAAFSRFLVGAFSTLPETVWPQLVILQEPLQLEEVARRFEEAATRLASLAPPTSDVAWQWAGLLHQLRGGHLATRRGAVILTASRPLHRNIYGETTGCPKLLVAQHVAKGRPYTHALLPRHRPATENR